MSGITDFYAAIQNKEFARKFQFRIETLGPLTESDLIYFTTASLPAKSNPVQKAPYMGVEFNIPGAVKYTGSDSWAVTFRCDEASNIRAKLLAWMTEIFSVDSSGGKYGTPVETATVVQLGKSPDDVVRTFNLIGIWPTEVGTLDYDITDAGQIQTFTATFAYQWWTEA